MSVLEIHVKCYFWEFIIKQHIAVQKINVKKYVLNLSFL